MNGRGLIPIVVVLVLAASLTVRGALEVAH
jgi:hypothetical protein